MLALPFRVALLAGLFVASFAPRAGAAESYDNCAGTIASLPATITTQGVWCLTSDLSTAIASGAAITIDANNVTLDCNDFKIGGLAAGSGTLAYGILVMDRLNAVVRRCNVRGFYAGVYTVDGGAHVVEDNRLEGNTRWGIVATGTGTSVRRNRVMDTGGTTAIDSPSVGIILADGAEAIDNLVAGVDSTGQASSARGINSAFNHSAAIRGNRISGITPDDGFAVYGIYDSGSTRLLIVDNQLMHVGGNGAGISCSSSTSSSVRNTITGFSIGVITCVSEQDSINTD